jgi:hypothetical protein
MKAPEKSAGHIMFRDGFEYFYLGGNNSIYRAPLDNFMEKTPCGNIRMGARFESTFNGWKTSPINPERKP